MWATNWATSETSSAAESSLELWSVILAGGFGLLGVVVGLIASGVGGWLQRRRVAKERILTAAAEYLTAFDLLVKRAQLEVLKEGHAKESRAEQRLRLDFIDLWSATNQKGYAVMAAKPKLAWAVSWTLGRLEWLLTPLVNLDYAGDADVEEIAKDLAAEASAFTTHRLVVAREAWGKAFVANLVREDGKSQAGDEAAKRTQQTMPDGVIVPNDAST